jgi:hypothetical protein
LLLKIQMAVNSTFRNPFLVSYEEYKEFYEYLPTIFQGFMFDPEFLIDKDVNRLNIYWKTIKTLIVLKEWKFLSKMTVTKV